MTTTQIKLVMSDIDGTLLDSTHQIDPALPEQLTRLQKQNIPFILASARSPKGMSPLAEQLGLLNDPLACYNGALILKTADLTTYQPIFSHELVTGEVAVILACIQKYFPAVSINLYSGLDWYVSAEDHWVATEAAITGETPQLANLTDLIQRADFPIHKLLLIGETAEINPLLVALESLALTRSTFYLSKENYLEVTHRGVSKEKALRELARYHHVPLAQTMAIGDNFNDLPMILLAGIGVAMANAPEAVKLATPYVTTSNDQHGVSHALEKFVLA